MAWKGILPNFQDDIISLTCWCYVQRLCTGHQHHTMKSFSHVFLGWCTRRDRSLLRGWFAYTPINHCPSPVLGHHPFLVLDIPQLLNCELQDCSCNIQCQRIHNWQRGKISILLQNCCLKPTRQVTRPDMINRMWCWLYENCDIAIAIFYLQLPATKPSTLVSLLCAQLRYGFLISVSLYCGQVVQYGLEKLG